MTSPFTLLRQGFGRASDKIMLRQCNNCTNQFEITEDDLGFYTKIGVPAPTFCPPCRFQRRLLWRNERTFYRRACDLCKRNIIAVYPSYAKATEGKPAEAKFPVYCQKCWWSDKWDPKSYGKDIDFSRPFLEQVRELWDTVPALSIQNDDGIASTNSEYAYDWAFSKNTYMSVCGWYTENCLYSFYACYDKDVIDSYFILNDELVYEAINCDKCFRVKYCTLCYDCTNCTLCYDMKGCSNCTMCVGLRNKQYHILNQPYSKEAYAEKLKELNLSNRDSLAAHMKEFREFALRTPRKFANNLKCTLCTGDSLQNSKNSKDCFYATNLENCRHMNMVDEAKDCYDCNNTGRPELCYESVTPDNSRGNKFSIFCWKCTEAEYSNNCHSCVGVIGCAALKHTSYAILNKQYEKAQYEKLRMRIIENMNAMPYIAQRANSKEQMAYGFGEFFPPEFSPHAYNETAALEWFPLTKEEALKKGFRWKDDAKKDYTPTKAAADLPKTIAETEDSIMNEVIECEHAKPRTDADKTRTVADKGCNHKCTTAFRIVPAELQLYRKLDVPIPTLCPNCRHYARLELRNPAQLWKRRCMCAGAQINADTTQMNADEKYPRISAPHQRQSAAYVNTRGHFHGDSPCPNEFETSFAPERPEIVYCESCYNSEIA
jgi:hypothetical protein